MSSVAVMVVQSVMVAYSIKKHVFCSK